MSNAAIRAAARERLKGNWTKAVFASLLVSLISTGASYIPVLGWFLPILLGGALAAGSCWFYMLLVREQRPQVANVFDGFRIYLPTLVLYVLTCIFILLWSLLLLIPGIIASLRYSMAFYIMMDQPGIQPMEAIRQSKDMMQGNKWRLFLLLLSFIGWALLCVLTLGIGFLWLGPYVSASYAQFYDELRQRNLAAYHSDGNLGGI